MSYIKDFWFFRYSGAGKTYASRFIRKRKKNSIIIDGDEIRKNISFDLNYSKKDRDLQILRIFGLAKIIIKSKYFPIISTVWMNKKILKKAKSMHIKVIRVLNRNYNKKLKKRKIKKNIVGIDIFYGKFRVPIIVNDKNYNFKKLLCKI